MMQASEVWVDDWLNDNFPSITSTSDLSGSMFQIVGDQSVVVKYSSLQMRLASIINVESKRPTILLDIIDSEWREPMKRYGIVRGMGPLSDAALLTDVMRNLGDRNACVNISMLSIPPPRTCYEILVKGAVYLIRLRRFLRCPYHTVLVAHVTNVVVVTVILWY